ncbi:uncharacterized protein V3H82_000074 isoform 1-T1 [Fundulus diaphanus]
MYLLVRLMLTFTAAAAGQNVSVSTVRAGDEVTLPCNNVNEGQNNCDRTNWTSITSMSTVTLFEAGQIQINTANKSERLSVTVKCSLVIKKVTMEDVGQYNCRQLTSEQQGQFSYVYLSVIHMTEQRTNDSAVLSCSVVDYNYCRHTVEWLYDGKAQTSSHVESIIPICRSTVTLTTSLHEHSAFLRSIKCKVTNNSTKKVQLFTFNHHLQVLNTAWHGWYIVVSVASTSILIFLLVFIKWKKTTGSKTKEEENKQEPNLQPEVTLLGLETSEDMMDPDGGLYYASVCCNKNTKVKYSVTSSTESISSPEATNHQDVVYAAVKKKKPDVTP